MLPVEECREAFSVSCRGGEGRIKASWGSIFGVSRARNRWTKWFPVSFTFTWNLCARVRACLRSLLRTSDVQRTSVTREALHLPAESFRRRAHEGMSAVIPKRGMLLYQLDKRYDTRGATIIAIEWLFVLLKGPFSQGNERCSGE